jgi:hypothetical protein
VLGVLVEEFLSTGIELFFNEPLRVYVPPVNVLASSEFVGPVEHPVADVRYGMLHGHYEFGSGEYADWWYISEQDLIKEEFYSCVQEFIDENA